MAVRLALVGFDALRSALICADWLWLASATDQATSDQQEVPNLLRLWATFHEAIPGTC